MTNHQLLVDALKKIKNTFLIGSSQEIFTKCILHPIQDNQFNDYVEANFSDCDNFIVYFEKGSPTKRTRTTFARYVRRVLKVQASAFADDGLTDISKNIYIDLIPVDVLNKKIKIIEGDAIVEFYKSKGPKTCMTGKEHSAYTQFYALNPDKVKLATLDDKYRCLIWTTDEGHKVFDYIYPEDGGFGNKLLQKWALENGYRMPYKIKQAFITMKHNGVFPYLDSFSYGKIDGDIITLSNDKFFKYNARLSELNGTYSKLKSCYYCFNYIYGYIPDNEEQHYCCAYCSARGKV